MRNISILGVTGSIGTQTVDVIRKNKENFKLIGISANTNSDAVIEIIKEFKPKYVAMMEYNGYIKVKEFCLGFNKNIVILNGIDGLIKIATIDEIDMVVTSVVGMIGLVPTIEAIRHKKDIALANKETLVVGGEIVFNEARKHGVKIIPVDSEHSAIFQCLQGNSYEEIQSIILTASGGPFRGKNRDELKTVSVEEALKHPKWNMGRKISIDSATLMNKGLEVIEAKWIFNVEPEAIKVVVHPESIIHSMVEYKDNSVIAQLSSTDMRLPIQYALNYPSRNHSVIDKLDFYKIKNLSFEEPDMETFQCLKLCYETLKLGGNVPTILNSANEMAVNLFLNKKIGFLQIEEIIRYSLDSVERKYNLDIETILETEKKVIEIISKKY